MIDGLQELGRKPYSIDPSIRPTRWRSGNHHHWRVGTMPVNRFQYGPAVPVGHELIRHDEIEKVKSREHTDRGITAFRFVNDEPRSSEQTGEDRSTARIVVDDECDSRTTRVPARLDGSGLRLRNGVRFEAC